MDQVSRALLAVGGGADAKTYVDDVFSTYLYTGNGGTQTITNGLDLNNKGGLVWTKTRSNLNPSYGNDNWLTYSTSVPTGDSFAYLNNVKSNTSEAAFYSGSIIGSFNIDGYSIASAAYGFNINTEPYVSWSFRKAPKFFDVVTYTGDGTNRDIAHSLGSVPGVVIVKQTSGAGGDWYVNVTALSGAGNSEYLLLNSTSASSADATVFRAMDPTSTTFPVGSNSGVNASGASYVAYLFGHDTSAEGLIQCGSFTTDGSGNASVTLGWEPQFLMVKASSTTGDWIMLDSMRGWNMTAADARLLANTTGAESTVTDCGNPTATGFAFNGGSASSTYIYMAIRRSNKPPTTGTDVFNLQTSVANGASVTGVISTSAARKVDAVIRAFQTADARNFEFFDRVRGFQSTSTVSSDSYTSPRLSSVVANAEVTAGTDVYQRSGTTFGEDYVAFMSATTGTINYALKRAPGFFDVVCYTGTGAATQTVAHNLGVVPELMIVKRRIGTTDNGWPVWTGVVDQIVWLNSQVSRATFSTNFPAAPTASAFTVGSGLDTGVSGAPYVAYLFASLPGISRVGTYTGNNASQTINCGFATGARFVLIKRTNNTSDWYVWDTARGIVSANDPHLSLNSAVAEVTTDDSIDPDNSGFVVNQLGATNMNATGGAYFYLAIA